MSEPCMLRVRTKCEYEPYKAYQIKMAQTTGVTYGRPAYQLPLECPYNRLGHGGPVGGLDGLAKCPVLALYLPMSEPYLNHI